MVLLRTVSACSTEINTTSLKTLHMAVIRQVCQPNLQRLYLPHRALHCDGQCHSGKNRSQCKSEHLRAVFRNYGSTPPTALRPVPPQPSSPKRMNFWIRFPVSTSAVYRLPWESMLTW